MGDDAISDRIDDLLRENERLKAEIRHLATGARSSFAELLKTGKAGGGLPYRFEELRDIPTSAMAPCVPPLVFLHVPKAGGTTLNHVLMKNYRFRVDSFGHTFRYFPNEFVSLVQCPRDDDTRRPVFFTGHINLANDIFTHMPVRYVTVTMLREPVARIVSHFRARATRAGSRFAAEINAGKMSVVEFVRRERASYPLQFELFAPGGDVDLALDNLANRISIFGLHDRYQEFLETLVGLLGLRDISHRRLNQTPSDAPHPTQVDLEDLTSELGPEIEFYRRATVLYAQRHGALAGTGEHPWTRYYA